MLKPSEFAVGDRIEVELEIVFREPGEEPVRFKADVVDRDGAAFILESDEGNDRRLIYDDTDTGRWTVKYPRGDTWTRWNQKDRVDVRFA